MKSSLAVREVPCDTIRVEGRYRKDMGDLQALADSIATVGLLHPPVITQDGALICGMRRLLAMRDILGWKTIPAIVLDVPSIVEGEFAENEIRKDFTPSERVAIAKAVEAEIGKRQGQRTDLGLRNNCYKVEPGVRTSDIAASKAGFDSFMTYERAKKVVEKAVEDVVEKMDSGDLSIAAAAVIADQPPEEQRKIVNMPAELRRQIVRKLREATSDLPTTAEARRIARETGMLVADRTGRYRSGLSDEERRALKQDLDAIWDVTRAVMALAETKLDPVELASRLEYWHCPGIRAASPVALDWLKRFEGAIRDKTEIS